MPHKDKLYSDVQKLTAYIRNKRLKLLRSPLLTSRKEDIKCDPI